MPPQACDDDDDDVKQNNRNREREREREKTREKKKKREKRERKRAPKSKVHALLCNSIKNISKYVHLFPSFDKRI